MTWKLAQMNLANGINANLGPRNELRQRCCRFDGLLRNNAIFRFIRNLSFYRFAAGSFKPAVGSVMR